MFERQSQCLNARIFRMSFLVHIIPGLAHHECTLYINVGIITYPPIYIYSYINLRIRIGYCIQTHNCILYLYTIKPCAMVRIIIVMEKKKINNNNNLFSFIMQPKYYNSNNNNINPITVTADR